MPALIVKAHLTLRLIMTVHPPQQALPSADLYLVEAKVTSILIHSVQSETELRTFRSISSNFSIRFSSFLTYL